MKILRIHTSNALISKEHKHSFDHQHYKISFDKELGMFRIDNTLVPVSNIREVLVEETVLKVTPLSVQEVEIAKSLPEDKPVGIKSKKKN